MSPVRRVANVGCCSGVGRRHLDGFRRDPRAELLAVCDVDDAGELLARDYGVAFYRDLETMLAAEEVDILDITSPDHLHARHILAGFDHGADVLCEKPLVLSLDDARRVRTAARRQGRFFMPAMKQRWQTAYRHARERIAAGSIGRPVFGRYVFRGTFYPYPEGHVYRSRESGGQLLHNGIHYTDLMCYLMGSIPVQVHARAREHYGTADRLETPNFHLAHFRLANGAMLEVVHNQLLHWQRCAETEIHIVGTAGSLHLEAGNRAVRVTTAAGHEFYPQGVDDRFVESEPFAAEIAHFLDCLDGAEPIIPMDDAIAIIGAVITAVACSGTDGSAPVPADLLAQEVAQ